MTDDRALPQWAQAAKPAAPALPLWAQEKPKPSGPTGGLGETWARTKELGASVRNDVQDELALGNDIIAAGKEKLAQPGVLPKIAGAADIGRGEINKVASPLTAVWNALGMADPMMTGGETVHMAGKGLKAAETPKATYPTGPKSSITQVPMPKWAAEANASAEEAFQAEHGRTKAQAASWPLTPETPAAPHAETWPHAAPTPAHVTPQQNPIAAPAVLSGGQVTTGPNHATIENATGAQDTGATAAKPAQAHMLSAGSNVIPKAPANDARLLLRQRIGLGTRDTKQSVARIQPYEKALNTLDKQGERDFWRYVENRSKKGGAGLRPRDPAVAAAADEWRAAAKQREAKMFNFDDAERMSFVEDYSPHMYEGSKPKAEGGIGTGASTFFHKRSIPTFAEAEKFGFKPKYPPAEMMGRYLAMMDKHIALKEVRETAKETKDIKRAMRGKQPEGWVELKGTRDMMGNSLYAPPDWAQAYNRTVDYVPHGGLWGSVRSVANASQSLSFVLNARHALTVGVEAMGAEVARAATHTAAGQFKTAAGAALKSAYAMAHYGLKGNKGLHLYDHDVTNFGEMGEIVSLLTQANAHSGGKLNYMSATKQGGLYKSYKAGSIPAEFKQYRANIASKASLLGKGAETAKTALTLIGRVMDDIQEPLFGYAIPRVKYGVSMEAMGDWLRLNPMATHAEKLAMAAKISDHVDNVFGELMLDNRFLDAKVREALEVALISVGWNYGFYSELAHGAKSTGKSFGQALNIKSPHYDPRAVGLIGMIAGSAIYNAIYQAVKTGTAPSEPMDLISAKTGGKNPDGTPARLAPITNMKEFVDLKYVLDAAARGESGKGTVEYARSKVKPIFTMAIDLVSGTDWKSQPILKPPSLIAGTGGEKAFNVAKEWTSNLLDFAWGGGKPFILNDRRGPNSGISDVERWLGLQPAGKRLANPKGSEESATRRGERNWHAKERGDAKQKALYKGTRG